jgi:metallo-beta-lactamase class B
MKIHSKILGAASLLLLLNPSLASPQKPTPPCTQCASWNIPQPPFKLYGNTFYVGPHGLSSILIDSGAGLVLIDGTLSESVPQIVANIRTLSFRVQDIKLILNSHVHYDHAGGIAELQRLSGATVVASKWSAAVLSKGGDAPDDPQYGILLPISPVANVRTLRDGEVLHLGNLTLTPHATPGHTPGGTSWTWQSCEAARCLNMVYMDSVSPVSADGFKYTQRPAYPHMEDFEQSFTFLETTPCDILVTAHPDNTALWDHLAQRNQGITPDPVIDPTGCQRLAARSRAALQKRIEAETAH